MISSKKNLFADFGIFISIVSILLVVGILFIYSASSVYALEKFGAAHYFVQRQLVGLVVGLCALIFARAMPLEWIKRLSPLGFLFSLGLTTLTLVPQFAQRIHGSSRWLNIGGFTFQPSELLKISFLIYLAYFLEKKMHKSSSFMHSYLPFLIILGSACLVLLQQPDFGSTVTLSVTAFTLLFIAHFQTRNLLITLIGLIPVVVSLILYKPYRLKRIATFLNPWSDPQGAGFQIIQSLIAIGSGSLWGVGISHSKQKFFYLPMQHTDFIFSIIAEETGFIGSCFLIMLFILLLYSGMRLAWQFNSIFSTYTTLGFVILTSLQAVINVAVAAGLVPTKGVGLPFVSYGNTALVCNMFMVGLIMNMVYTHRNNL